MIEQKDYIMRIIHEWIRTLIKLIFNRDIDRDEEEAVPLEAENILLDGLDAGSRAYFEMALLFYEKLGGKPEAFLTEHDYSQEEVIEGLKYVVNYYGYGSLMDAFTEELG